MKKSDLKDGMVVETRDGIKYLIRTLKNGDKILSAMDRWLGLDDGYDEDLNDDCFKDLDIVKIFTTNEFVLSSVFNENSLNLIWERKREIDWSKVPTGTPVQVIDWQDDFNDFTGKDIFIKYEPKLIKYPFIVAENFEREATSYKYCRIHPDVKIQDDWYKEDDGAVG